MTFEVRVELQPDFVQVTCHGEFDVEELLRAGEHALRTAADEDRHAIVVDMRGLGGLPSTMDRFEVGSRIAAIQTEYYPNIIMTAVGDEPLVDPKRLAETVARNRYASLRVFTDFDQAVGWIRSNLSESQSAE